jgi:F420-dependent oxidoreductase-like protein
MPHGDFTPDVDDTLALDGDKLECWSVLAALAAAVPRLRLGTLVSSVTFRHPAVIANIAAAVDNISGGRLVLGVGAGWQRNEHVAYGIELGTIAERLDRFEEACAVINSLLHERRTTFEGNYYRIADAPNQPAPVQARLPLLIGGGGEKRTLRIAARYADIWNSWTTPDALAAKVRVLYGHCEAIGRDPAAIDISTQAPLFLSEDESWLATKRNVAPGRSIVGTPSEVADIVRRYRDAGAGEIVIPDSMEPLTSWKETCDLFIGEVASQLR